MDHQFRATQTEKSAMDLLSIMPILMACGVPVCAADLMYEEGSVKMTLEYLLRLSLWLLLWSRRNYLHGHMKRHPIILAVILQCVGHVAVLFGMTRLALQTEGLQRAQGLLDSRLSSLHRFRCNDVYANAALFGVRVSTLYGRLFRLPCSGGRYNGALCCVDYFLFWSMRLHSRLSDSYCSLWSYYLLPPTAVLLLSLYFLIAAF
jgi:hypothetical protein